MLLAVFSLGAFGAKKPPVDKEQRFKFEHKLKPAPEPTISQYPLTTPQPQTFRFYTGDTLGFTYYDYQHNNSQRRQMANDYNRNLHFSWMNLIGPDMANYRYVDYNCRYNDGTWLGAMHVTPGGDGGGYCGLDILPDSREVLAFHRCHGSPHPDFANTYISIERTAPGAGGFRHYDIPDSVAGRSERLVWPYIGIAKVGTPAYIHITNFSPDDFAGYVRCYQDPSAPDTLMCQSPGWPSAIKVRPGQVLEPNKVLYHFPADSILTYNAAPVATSPVSEKVAIVWYDETEGAAWYKGEIYYVESSTNGDDWMTNGNCGTIHQITNYGDNDWEDYWTYYTEIAAVYDYDDVLHIIWTTTRTDSIHVVTLWHWSLVTGIREISSRRAYDQYCGAWNGAIAKPTIGVGCVPTDTAYNYLYVVYTGFNNEDISLWNFANGDLFVQVSGNGGLTWGPEVNLTNTSTPDCPKGNCESEHWASVAERVDSFMYVQYVYDRDAGGIPQEEGEITLNPIRYLKERRRLPPPVPHKRFTPLAMISPPLWATNGGNTTNDMHFENTGTADLHVKITGLSYVNPNPSQFMIAEGGTQQTVILTFNGAGFSDTLLVDSIMIESNDGVAGGEEVYVDTEWVKFHFVVTDTFYYPEYDTCTRGVNLTVSNVGNLGNQEESNMMNFNDHDYLFDFTPAFATKDPGHHARAFTWLHDRHNYLAENHIKKIDYPQIKTTTCFQYSAPVVNMVHWVEQYPWHHMWFGWAQYSRILQFEYDTADVHAVRVRTWWKWNRPPAWWPDIEPLTAPAAGYSFFGIAADWDVPAEAARRNRGGYDKLLKMIYLYSDSVGFENYYAAFIFRNAMVIQADDTTTYTQPHTAKVLCNATYLFPEGGYHCDSLFLLMNYPYPDSGYWVEPHPAYMPYDSSVDRNMVMTFAWVLDPDTSTMIIEDYDLLATDQGFDGNPASLCSLAVKLGQFTAGDANADGSVGLVDVVFLINYMFKAGSEPLMAFSDANADGDVGLVDIVYLIGYLFKAGPAPKLVWDIEPWNVDP